MKLTLLVVSEVLAGGNDEQEQTLNQLRWTFEGGYWDYSDCSHEPPDVLDAPTATW